MAFARAPVFLKSVDICVGQYFNGVTAKQAPSSVPV